MWLTQLRGSYLEILNIELVCGELSLICGVFACFLWLTGIPFLWLSLKGHSYNRYLLRWLWNRETRLLLILLLILRFILNAYWCLVSAYLILARILLVILGYLLIYWILNWCLMLERLLQLLALLLLRKLHSLTTSHLSHKLLEHHHSRLVYWERSWLLSNL